eukprot:8034110-Alexandrium_andersonii.AAC.1
MLPLSPLLPSLPPALQVLRLSSVGVPPRCGGGSLALGGGSVRGGRARSLCAGRVSCAAVWSSRVRSLA